MPALTPVAALPSLRSLPAPRPSQTGGFTGMEASKTPSGDGGEHIKMQIAALTSVPVATSALPAAPADAIAAYAFNAPAIETAALPPIRE